MKIDLSYRATSAVQTSLPGRLLMALGIFLLIGGMLVMLSNPDNRRTLYGSLMVWSCILPLLLRSTLDGPSVLAVTFVPALFSYQRGFVFRAVRIRNIDRVRVEGQTFEVIRKNGKVLAVQRCEFPGVDFAALARRLEEASRTHSDILSFFQSEGVAGFTWIDPHVRRPISAREKRTAAAFFVFLTLALAGWVLYLISR